jgi:hypothetical protein
MTALAGKAAIKPRKGLAGKPLANTAPTLLPKTALEWKLHEAVPTARLRLPVALVGSRTNHNEDPLS